MCRLRLLLKIVRSLEYLYHNNCLKGTHFLFQGRSQGIPRHIPSKKHFWQQLFSIPCRPERHEIGHLFRANGEFLHNSRLEWLQWQSRECAQILEWKIPILWHLCLSWEEHFMHHL